MEASEEDITCLYYTDLTIQDEDLEDLLPKLQPNQTHQNVVYHC